jgi:hypothetical protein
MGVLSATAGPELQRNIADRLQHMTALPVQIGRVRTTMQEERAVSALERQHKVTRSCPLCRQ